MDVIVGFLGGWLLLSVLAGALWTLVAEGRRQQELPTRSAYQRRESIDRR